MRVPLHAALAALVLLTVLAHAQRETDEPAASEPRKGGESKSKLDEELFKKLFAQRRKDHVEAVQTLLKMDNYERLYKMIAVLTEKIVEVIESSRSVIGKAGFLPHNSSFPVDTGVKDALSSILENTALFGDIVLHLPDISHRILRTQPGWNSTIHWSLNFANQTRHLLNKSTITMFRLVEQELNVTEREPGYFNPYRSAAHAGQREDTVKKKRPAKKEKRKKGPQIAKIEL
ncbi:PREDICTED: coiled-coil domain-containing protein 134-like [Vollenhovia emeryi]|uniref:coiled-coil domain-containing protein 134-like n=1 Tax=Vollenhovia emeryi TaxID=411798 RepID=UPI0005F4825A|nr:PREDICTED: coiled-coil domain-containing protein 134-like [Vollenhovia emeryi]